MLLQFAGKSLSILQDLKLIVLEIITERLAESNCFRRYYMDQGTALNSGKQLPINFLRMFFLTQDQSSTRSPQCLMRGGRNVIRVRHWRRVKACGDWSGNMRDVSKHPCANTSRNLSNSFEIDCSRISRCATYQQLWPMFFSNSLQFVVVDLLCLF